MSLAATSREPPPAGYTPVGDLLRDGHLSASDDAKLRNLIAEQWHGDRPKTVAALAGAYHDLANANALLDDAGAPLPPSTTLLSPAKAPPFSGKQPPITPAEKQRRSAIEATLRSTLANRGYDSATATATLSTRAAYISQVMKRGVAATDEDFARVARLAGKTTGDVVVAFIERGFASEHPVLQDNRANNPNEIPGDDKDNDENGKPDDDWGWSFPNKSGTLAPGRHGTHTTATGTWGSHRIKALPLEINYLKDEYFLEAIDYAAQRGARIINISIAVGSSYLIKEVRAKINQYPRISFVIAAGNAGRVLSAPGGYSPGTRLAAEMLDNTTIVANANRDGSVHAKSNYGAEVVSVAAYGTEQLSAAPANSYAFMTGTSMATPVATQVKAKCLLLAPRLRPAQLRQILEVTASPHEAWAGLSRSGGILNPGLAYRLAALIGMVWGGAKPEVAAGRLRLSRSEIDLLLPALELFPLVPPTDFLLGTRRSHMLKGALLSK